MSKNLVRFGIKNNSNNKDILKKEFCGTVDSLKIDGDYSVTYSASTKGCDEYFNPVIRIPRYHTIPEIKTVIFNPPYTIVKWCDNTVTKIRCINEDDFNEEIGLAMAISRKYYEFVVNTGWTLAKEDKKENKGARAEFKKQVKNAKRPKKKE